MALEQAMQQLAVRKSSKPVEGFSTVDQQDEWLMAMITQGEILKPGSPVMNDSSLELLLTLYSETLETVGKAQFQAAFLKVLRDSSFRPDIADIRRAAGLHPNDAAMAALRTLIVDMRVHWMPKSHKMQPRLAKRVDGVLVRDSGGTEWLAPPDPTQAVVLALRELGFGDVNAGLEFVYGHPALDAIRPAEELDHLPFRSTAGEKIEKRWCEIYGRTQ